MSHQCFKQLSTHVLLQFKLGNLHKPFKIEAWKEMTKSLRKLFHSYPTRHRASVPTPL